MKRFVEIYARQQVVYVGDNECGEATAFTVLEHIPASRFPELNIKNPGCSLIPEGCLAGVMKDFGTKESAIKRFAELCGPGVEVINK